MIGKSQQLESIFLSRRKTVQKQIRGQALLLVSAEVKSKSRDQSYPYRQDSNFFYLSGIEEPSAALLLLGGSRGPRSVLFLKPRDAEAERWAGERIGLRRAKARFQVDEVRSFERFGTDLKELLHGSAVLHYAPGVNAAADTQVWSLMQQHMKSQSRFPHTLKDARLILHKMRAVKDRHEIRSIKHAVDITAHGLIRVAEVIQNVKSESHGAKLLEMEFAGLGASETGFDTIVASGKNATILHHSPKMQPIWKKQLVLFDAGAQFQGYSGDISRTLPASGSFSPVQALLYDAVLSALRVGIKRAKPGATMKSIHEAVVKETSKQLVELRVLKGDLDRIIEKEKYKAYFMHKTGHFLGIDVHDVAPPGLDKYERYQSFDTQPLVPKNVITIEPGLYFSAADKSIPKEFRGIGIRIEEDVLITADGCEVLSSAVPVERSELEAIMNG